jgi:hypothetical protein
LGTTGEQGARIFSQLRIAGRRRVPFAGDAQVMAAPCGEDVELFAAAAWLDFALSDRGSVLNF